MTAQTYYAFLYIQHAELNRQLQVQLSGVREEHQAVLGRLTEAHDLLEKHVETSNRAQESEVKITHTDNICELYSLLRICPCRKC